jgi:hypothetical protein
MSAAIEVLVPSSLAPVVDPATYASGMLSDGVRFLVEAVGPDGIGMALVALAVVLVVLGLAWIRRIASGEPEPRAWRSRDATPARIPGPPRIGSARIPQRAPIATMRPDVRRARAMARVMLAISVALAIVVFVRWIAAPDPIQPMFGPPWYFDALPWLGAAGYLVGLGWMVRIYRARPEDGERTWRYRARR